MHFVSNDEYYELKAKCVARRKDAYSVLMQLNNLSQAAQSSTTSALDEGLRQIYTLFERISLLDLDKNCVVPLYTGVKSDLIQKHEGLTETARAVARLWIFMDDQDDFVRFWEAETMEKRLDESGRGSVSAYFRCLVNNGRYEWKQFILLRYRPGQVLELVRNARRELDRFQLQPDAAGQAPGGVSDETLWQNLVHTDILKLFWKDTERRFLGANRGFLNYYGFRSDRELIGRTDEDLGWHVHPDLYMNDEYRVISQGITVYNSPGRCISNGVNRDILASKTPLFSLEGDIVGMLGCFVERDQAAAVTGCGESNAAGQDEMTGLLNLRGLREQAYAFRDEYFLRNADFLCLYVSLDDMSGINQQYGYDFGDRVIAALGEKLKEAFGKSAAVGRSKGYQFMIVRQLRDKTELPEIRGMVKRTAKSIREVDGAPVTLYLSLGYSLFSESKDLEIMAQSAEMRLLLDHDSHAPVGSRKTGSSDFFRLYDDLPISYAVYRVHTNKKMQVTDAEILYANHLFERRAGIPVSEMLGHSVRDLFPMLDEKGYEIAGRSALRGETITENIYFEKTGIHYYMTANQIIRPGFCSFTYQEIDSSGKPMAPGGPGPGPGAEA